MPEDNMRNVEAVTPAASDGAVRKLPRTSAPLKNTASFREGISRIKDLAKTLDEPSVDRAALEIGQEIRRARLSKGLTQEDVARSARISQGALSDIERGRRIDGPSYRILRQVADALGVDIALLPREAYLPSPEEAPKSILRKWLGTLRSITPEPVVAIEPAAADVASSGPSLQTWIEALLGEYELSTVHSELLHIVQAPDQTARGDAFCKVWNIGPHSSTRLKSNDAVVFLTIKGAGTFTCSHPITDKVCVAAKDDIVDVINTGPSNLKVVCVHGAWFQRTVGSGA
jgi:transcriptional regulator with XRE-family HTH domain